MCWKGGGEIFVGRNQLEGALDCAAGGVDEILPLKSF